MSEKKTPEEYATEIRQKAEELSDLLEEAWDKQNLIVHAQAMQGGIGNRCTQIAIGEIRKTY